jgi:hypothetical protein
MNTRRQRVLAVASALGGLLLFGYAVRRAGLDNIVDGIGRVGWGLIPILLLGGLRFVVRAEAWRLCAAAGARLPFGQAFTAFLSGDAIGNITPLGLIASEPTKVFLIRHHLATRESVTSLAIDNVVYAASVIVMIAAGVIVMLTRVPMPFAWQEWSVVVLVGLMAIGAGGLLAIRSGWSGPALPSRLHARLSAMRAAMLEFSAGHPTRLWRVFALDMVFHGLAVFEAYLTLEWLLGAASPTFTEALAFEALNRVMTVLFKFVPFRVGVDEAASGALAPVLALNPVAGVSLAVIRKVRNLFWAATGLALIGVHHVRAVPETDPRGTAHAHRT